MRKVILLLLCLVILTSFSSAAVNLSSDYCYQETANVSTSCGGLSTGNYAFNTINNWAAGVSVIYDGDFSTSTFYNLVGQNGFMYINYSKPTRATNESRWKIRDNNGQVNLTINKSCWDYDSSKIVLRVESSEPIQDTVWYCFNGSWMELRRGTTFNGIYEEAMMWNYIPLYEVNQSYNSTTYETSLESFGINLTYDNSYYLDIVATLNYNGNTYTTSKVGSGSNIRFERSINVPAVSSETNKTFYWTIALTDSTSTSYFNSTFNNQTVKDINLVRCNATMNVSYINFSVYNITDLARANTPFRISFNYTISGGVEALGYDYQETGSTNSSFAFCLSPGDKQLSVNAIASYGGAIGFAPNYYYMNAQTLTNSTTYQSLYLLSSELSTITTVRAINSMQNGLVGYFIKIYQQDPGTNDTRLFSTLKTNYNGQDIAYLNWYNTLYRFDVLDSSNNIVNTADPFKVFSSPQTIRVVTLSTSPSDKFNDLAFNLSVNNNTRTFLLTYSTTKNITAGCLRIVKIGGSFNSSNIVSDVCLNASSGALTYTIPEGDYARYYAVFYALGSYSVKSIISFQALDYLNDVYSAIGNLDGTILALMIVGMAAGIGLAISPVAFIVTACLGYVLAIMLGFQSMNSGNFQIAFFGFLAMAGYLVWKMRT